MSALSDPRVLRRFIILMAILTFVMFSLWVVVQSFVSSPAGDFETRQGDILLGDGKFEEAIERFDEALRKQPDHRGALGGRAIALMSMERYPEAEAELTYLIDYLNRNVEPDDRTGVAALAAAYANRGILKDRQGRYEEALKDYVDAINTDEGVTEGPSIFDKILYYEHKPASVRGRAVYLYKQLQLPENERRLRVPELDSLQRMHKP